MDFAPVRAELWDCRDPIDDVRTVANASSRASVSASGSDQGTVLELAAEAGGEISSFGGQSRCPECRCFESSLRELTQPASGSGVTTYGSCFRANCYRRDYLQVGVRGQVDSSISWYRCPEAGGRLRIAGFTGSLVCPPAREVCQYEEPTGVRHLEAIILIEWVLWVAVLGLPILLVSFCICVRCFREAIVRRLKHSCGVGFFAILAPLDPRDRW